MNLKYYIIRNFQLWSIFRRSLLYYYINSIGFYLLIKILLIKILIILNKRKKIYGYMDLFQSYIISLLSFRVEPSQSLFLELCLFSKFLA